MRTENNEEGTFKAMGDRFASVIRGVSLEAFEELKTGVDKAWDEIKMGIDEGIQATSTGMNKAWAELSQSIERAKDSLFMVTESRESSQKKDVTPAPAKGRASQKKEKDNLN